MPRQADHEAIVKQIKERFGSSIDLDANPGVLIEVLRNFGHVLDDDGGGGGGGMGSGPDDGVGGAEGMGPGGPGPGDGGGGGMGSGPDDGVGGGGGGGGVSSIAVAGPDAEAGVRLDEVMREVLNLRKEVRNLSTRRGQQNPGT